MKKISIVSCCYNEVDLIELFEKKIVEKLTEYHDKYDYEIIVIDNNSTDGTQEKLKILAKKNKKLKVIFCTKNFRSERSFKHALSNSTGDCIIHVSTDLEQPLSLIDKFIESWESGSKITFGSKISSDELFILKFLKKIYYKIVSYISDDIFPVNTEGMMFDKSVKDTIIENYDPNPYLRGTVFQLFEDYELIEFEKKIRKIGKSKSSFGYLLNLGTESIFKMSLKPLRVIIFIGFLMSFFSLLVALFYFFYKILYWDTFALGIAPIIIGLFLILSLIITMLGVIGQYIIILVSYAKKLPTVVEKDRINFH